MFKFDPAVSLLELHVAVIRGAGEIKISPGEQLGNLAAFILSSLVIKPVHMGHSEIAHIGHN